MHLTVDGIDKLEIEVVYPVLRRLGAAHVHPRAIVEFLDADVAIVGLEGADIVNLSARQRAFERVGFIREWRGEIHLRRGSEQGDALWTRGVDAGGFQLHEHPVFCGLLDAGAQRRPFSSGDSPVGFHLLNQRVDELDGARAESSEELGDQSGTHGIKELALFWLWT